MITEAILTFYRNLFFLPVIVKGSNQSEGAGGHHQGQRTELKILFETGRLCCNGEIGYQEAGPQQTFKTHDMNSKSTVKLPL